MTTYPLPYRIYYAGPDETLAIVAENMYDGDGSQVNQDLIYEANSDRFLCGDRTLRQYMRLIIPPLP
jgi:hypothetical protein